MNHTIQTATRHKQPYVASHLLSSRYRLNEERTRLLGQLDSLECRRQIEEYNRQLAAYNERLARFQPASLDPMTLTICAGTFLWNGVLYKGKHAPLISQGLFQRVETRISRLKFDAVVDF